MKTIVISLLLIYSLNAQQYLKVIFNEPMNLQTISTIDNYKIVDEFGKEIKIPGLITFQNEDTFIILILNRLRQGNYFLVVTNVEDVAGNLINKDKNSIWFKFVINPSDPNFKK